MGGTPQKKVRKLDIPAVTGNETEKSWIKFNDTTPTYRVTSELKPLSALNEVFKDAKDAAYWENLTADIKKHGIIDPLIITKDGHIVEGHSRWEVAQKLGFETVPVRIITSDLNKKEIERRLLLGNLNRFEIDSTTRLDLFVRAWPEYFKTEGKGEKSILSKISNEIGLTKRQIKREKKVYLKAKELAKGREIKKEHIQEARELGNKARREKTPRKKQIHDKVPMSHKKVEDAVKAIFNKESTWKNAETALSKILAVLESFGILSSASYDELRKLKDKKTKEYRT